MTALEILQEVIGILVGGITEVATAMGQGISTIVETIAFTGTGETQALSTVFILVLVFGGVSLALSLFRLLFSWIMSLTGKRI